MSKCVCALVLIALLLPVAAWSQGPDDQPRWQGQRPGARIAPAMCVSALLAPPPPQMIENQAERLGISEDQKQKLKAVFESARTKLEPLDKKLGEAIAALRKGLFAPEKDAPSVKDLATAAQRAEADVAAARLAIWLEIRSILKPDQLTKLGELIGRPRRTGPPPGAPPPPPPPGE